MAAHCEIAAQRRLEVELSPLQDGSRLGQRIALSSTYMIAGRLGMRGIGIVSTLVLVRILAPQDFGIVALAQMVYPILDLLTATGFNLAIFRMRDPDPAHYDTAWNARGLHRHLPGCHIRSASSVYARTSYCAGDVGSCRKRCP
jgi:hypothetical protein